MKCHECNSQMIEVREEYHYTESGLSNVYLSNVCVYRCDCGEFFPSIPAVIKLNETIGRSIVKKKGGLTGEEIKYLRKNIGLSAKKFAEYLGVNQSTLSRWENEKQTIDKSNDRVVRMIYAHFKNLPLEEHKTIVEDSFRDIDGTINNVPIRVPIEVLSNSSKCSFC